MNIPYDYVVHNIGTESEPAYKAVIPAINAVVYGDNAKELEKGIMLSIQEEKKVCAKLKHAMPKPERTSTLSGKLVIRIDPGLHEHLALTAKARGMSLNRYIAYKVAH